MSDERGFDLRHMQPGTSVIENASILKSEKSLLGGSLGAAGRLCSLLMQSRIPKRKMLIIQWGEIG